MVEGKKVSGNAFYHIRGLGIEDRGLGGGNQKSGISIVHGTMLYDTNMENMLGAITPSATKLDSKGVKSVKSHITTLNRYLTMSIEEFQQHAHSTLCDGEIMLSDSDIAAIERIEAGYLTPEFILGNNPRCNMERSGRIEGVGEFKITLELNRNIIRHINLAGDFFLLGDLDRVLHALRGTTLQTDALLQAIPDDLPLIVRNLTKQQLNSLLLG